jgi:hypothetical protein
MPSKLRGLPSRTRKEFIPSVHFPEVTIRKAFQVLTIAAKLIETRLGTSVCTTRRKPILAP